MTGRGSSAGRGQGPGPLATGERIVLRRLVHGDEARLERFLRVPEVRRALRLGETAPAEDAAFAAALVAGPAEGLVVGIASRADGRLLGLCGLDAPSGVGHQAELGLFIGDPADWNKGYGTEATKLLVGYGFRALGLERIRLEVHDDHAAAIRAYERAGFRLDRPLGTGGTHRGRRADPPARLDVRAPVGVAESGLAALQRRHVRHRHRPVPQAARGGPRARGRAPRLPPRAEAEGRPRGLRAARAALRRRVPPRVPDTNGDAVLLGVRDGDPFFKAGVAQYELLPWLPNIGKEDLDKA